MMPHIPTPQELQEEFRGGDDRKVNVGPGEVVVPTKVLNDHPALGPAIAQAIAASGANPDAYVVGSPDGNYNPQSGNQEFFFRAISKFFKKNPIAAPLATIASSFLPGGRFIAPIVSGLTTKATGASTGQALGAVAGTALGQWLGASGTTAGSALAKTAAGDGALSGFAKGTSDFLSGSTFGDAALATDLGSVFYGSLGSGFGSMVGGMVDPSKPEASQFNTDPNVSPIRAAALPTGGGGASALPIPNSQAPNQVAAEQFTPYVPAGVSYLTPTKNRDTGETKYTRNAFGNHFRSSRRNGFSNVIAV